MKKNSRKMRVLLPALMLLFGLSSGFSETVQEEPEVDLSKLFGEGEKVEIEVHYGMWTLDVLKSLFEQRVIDELSGEIRDEIIGEVRDSHPGILESGFVQTLALDSGGSTYGVELRFYPRGRESGFSLGLALEKTTMRVTIQGTVRQDFTDGTSAEVENAKGEVSMSPFFTNLSFRWDFMPEWRVTPYFVFGLGVAALDGEVRYEYLGAYHWSGPDEEIGDAQVKTIKEAEEDFSTNIPNILPLLQLNFGVRAEVIPHLHLRAEAGVWDGVVLRAGVAYLF